MQNYLVYAFLLYCNSFPTSRTTFDFLPSVLPDIPDIPNIKVSRALDNRVRVDTNSQLVCDRLL